jgi:lincosamide and streptogramin A transport system ATP-binding/permease protein
MSLINISNLTFAYEGSYDNIFEDVSFQIDTDWKLGFTGRNGRGKTTFLNLLLGKYPYRGSISANVDFEYFPYEVPDKAQNTADVVFGINPEAAPWEIQRELNLLEVAEDVLYRPFDTLSNGERTKVLLAVLFTKENSFLLIDEPTNHLDMEARETVGRYLKGKAGFILVSHDRALLDACTDHTLSINRANIEIRKGNFSSWWENKQRQDSFELAENEKLKGEIRRLKEAARRTAEWSDKAERTKIGYDPVETENFKGRRAMIGEKSRKMMKRSKNLEQRQQTAIEEKSQLLKNIESADRLKLTPLGYQADRLVSARDLALFYGVKTVLRGASFTVERGDRIAFTGKNGSGKSSLLKLVCGEDIGYTGSFIKGSGLAISYVSQDASFLKGNLSDYAREKGIDESLFKAILRKLDFPRVQFEKDMADFSEGQKKKVLIAESLSEKAHLYIWDEPLNYIDVLSRMQIEELLLAYTPTILFVEHDRAFIEKIATKVVRL